MKLWWELDLNRIGNKYFVGAHIFIDGNVRDIITPARTLIFKLANGEIITLYANDEYPPTAQVVAGSVTPSVKSVYHAKYDISEEDMQKMASSPPTVVRVEIGDARKYDSQFNAKQGAAIQQKAYCIMQ